MINKPIPVTFNVILNSSIEGFFVILKTLLDSMKKDFILDSEKTIWNLEKIGFIKFIMV